MLSISAGSATSKRTAWSTVAICATAIFFVLSAPAVLMPVMYGSIMDQTGWSYGQVTAFSSWKFLSGAITSLILGFIIDFIRIKIVAVAGACLSGLSLLAMQFVDSPTIFYLLGFAIGTSAVVITICCKGLLSHWFNEDLGLAVGVAFTGGSIAGVLVPLVSVVLLEAIGWRNTAAFFGAATLIFVVPVISLFLREKPGEGPVESFGDHDSNQLVHDAQGTGGSIFIAQPIDKIVTGSTFWKLMFAHFLVGGVDYALMEHTALYIEKDAGLGKSVAAGAITIIMLAGMCGKIGFGWLYDRFSMHGIAFCWWSLALGVVLAFPVSGTITLTLFAIVRGVSHGGVMIDPPSLVLHNFGTRALAKLVSFLSFANMLGAALSTTLIGYIRDATGSYTLSFVILIVLAVVAGLIAFSIRPEYWHWQRRIKQIE